MTQPNACAVCGDPEPDEALLAQCFECGASYHLNPYNNRPGRDCGDAIIGETLGVHYYCEPCLVRISAEAAPADPAAGFMPPGFAPPPGAPARRSADGPAPPPRTPRPGSRRRYRRIDPR